MSIHYPFLTPSFHQLPDSFIDEYKKKFKVAPSPEIITHCRREMYHEVIKLILQGRFAEAYEHGILIKFPDGIIHRVFPRFYCYTADYPEKFVLFLRYSSHSLRPLAGFSLLPSRILEGIHVHDAW